MKLSPRTLLACAMPALVLANVGRIPSGPFGGRTAAVTLNDLMLVPLWCMLAALWLRRRGPVRLDHTTRWTIAFAIVASLSTVLAILRYSLGLGAAIGVSAFLVRWILYAGWYMVPGLDAREDDAAENWKLVDRALLAVAAFGIVQSLFLPGFAQRVHVGGDGSPVWDEQGRRLVSTLLDPNFAGILIVMALLPRIARVIEGVPTSRRIIGLLVLALLLTLSRSSILALLVGAAVLATIRGLSARLLRLFLLSGLVLLPVLLLLADFAEGYNKLRLDASAVQRLIPWGRAIRLVQMHPWLGVGFNAIDPAQRELGWTDIGGAQVSLDGGLLFLAAMTGLLGLLAYGGILTTVLSSARRTWRSALATADERSFAAGTAAVTAALLIHSFFANSLLLPFVMEVSWLRWGVNATIARRVRDRAMAASTESA